MISARTVVAGVVGQPIAHSLSPILHNAWLAAAGIDGVYVAFAPRPEVFAAFVEGQRGGGAIRGVNVTVPFKEEALAAADEASARARLAGAANLLVFETDGRIRADNTDGLGLLGAFAAQAEGFDPAAGPVVVLGAGGAARGAAAALLLAGTPQVRVLNRTVSKAQDLASDLGPKVVAGALADAGEVFAGAIAVINATAAGMSPGQGLDVPLEATPPGAVVMDMFYKPLVTPFLAQAQALGRRTVDGLEMLVRQAEPSFEALFGAPPPPGLDVRGLALKVLNG
ncbi:MAG: shikimate dehydrogenase [Phenylobacterium sp.]|jgi:shikimate dehydrogenase|uniref:shikimate dehydrogenase n=1 Tax=Phenylobacterium sp. TaxID=1871053 RepID=UPI001A1812C5|nr:shikimate dehydrogenase [Phenylobacterium sp.]MBJ7413393.1 shikimate dehydrogenase [Phenylobacterium sp.]